MPTHTQTHTRTHKHTQTRIHTHRIPLSRTPFLLLCGNAMIVGLCWQRIQRQITRIPFSTVDWIFETHRIIRNYQNYLRICEIDKPDTIPFPFCQHVFEFMVDVCIFVVLFVDFSIQINAAGFDLYSNVVGQKTKTKFVDIAWFYFAVSCRLFSLNSTFADKMVNDLLFFVFYSFDLKEFYQRICKYMWYGIGCVGYGACSFFYAWWRCNKCWLLHDGDSMMIPSWFTLTKLNHAKSSTQKCLPFDWISGSQNESTNRSISPGNIVSNDWIDYLWQN